MRCVELSIWRQCQLAGSGRSGLYHEPIGESELNLELMRKIDEQYLLTPFYVPSVPDGGRGHQARRAELQQGRGEAFLLRRV